MRTFIAGLSILFHSTVSDFQPILFCFDYYSRVIILKSGRVILPALFFFLRMSFAIQETFVAVYTFFFNFRVLVLCIMSLGF